MKRITTLLAVSATAVLLSTPAMAFHSGGVAECEGCHTMHNSYEGTTVKKEDGTNTGLATQYQSGPYLLKANDQSSACLNCHESTPGSYHISTPYTATGVSAANQVNPVTQFTPGGDFTWLKLSYSYSAYNAAGSEESLGERHGHNINAGDYGYVADQTQTVAPGGVYLASKLHCSSCHDPHGRYRRTADNGTYATTGAAIYSSGSYGAIPGAKSANGVTFAVGAYRILGGANYAPKSYQAAPFGANPPLAIAPTSYNTSETSFAGNTIVKYGSGMSEWCANCHYKIAGGAASGQTGSYTTGMAGLVHPVAAAAQLSNGYPATIANNYSKYLGSGNMNGTGGSYTNLVPYETGDATATTLTSTNILTGVPGSAQAMCLSCHRAHASGFSSMLRFDAGGTEFQTTLDTNNAIVYPGTDINGTAYNTKYGPKNMGRSVSDWTAAYWGRPATVFGAYQRVLCNKCHAKD